MTRRQGNKLTLKQRRFVEAYCGEAAGNATQAAKLAGYSSRTARSQGQRLLTTN
jgi:phage terminase small subunit